MQNRSFINSRVKLLKRIEGGDKKETEKKETVFFNKYSCNHDYSASGVYFVSCMLIHVQLSILGQANNAYTIQKNK